MQAFFANPFAFLASYILFLILAYLFVYLESTYQAGADPVCWVISCLTIARCMHGATLLALLLFTSYAGAALRCPWMIVLPGGALIVQHAAEGPMLVLAMHLLTVVIALAAARHTDKRKHGAGAT